MSRQIVNAIHLCPKWMSTIGTIMNQKLWIQYSWYGHQMLRPLGELLAFEINNGQENIIFLLSSNEQKT